MITKRRCPLAAGEATMCVGHAFSATTSMLHTCLTMLGWHSVFAPKLLRLLPPTRRRWKHDGHGHVRTGPHVSVGGLLSYQPSGFSFLMDVRMRCDRKTARPEMTFDVPRGRARVTCLTTRHQ